MERFCQRVGYASQRMFGCLWRVLCDSHGPARWTRVKTVRPKNKLHIVVALHHHVGLEGRARARTW